MSDLIERQAAIDAVCKVCANGDDFTKCRDRELKTSWCDNMIALRDLPSANQSTIGQLSGAAQSTKTDTVSRQAAIDNLERYRELFSWDDGDRERAILSRVIKELQSMPSAQPERCVDCVNFNKTQLLIPQPEIIRCKDCKHYEEINQPYPQMFCRRHQLDTLEDDYCSYGEKA